MKHNYHTHTYRCHHASGTEKEYIEKAIENGLTTLGFADHSPYIFPGDYYSKFRMALEETKEYYQTLGTLREEYAGKIDIHIGFEMEYYPLHFRETLEFMKAQEALLPSGKRAGLQYLILGQHFIRNEYDYPGYSANPNEKESFIAGYVQNVTEGIKTGSFSYIAHPDLANYTGPKTIYERYMSELIQCAKEHDTPLEINLLGLHTHRNYPNPLFWDLVKEIGGTVVMGCDAHAAEAVGNPSLVAEGEAFAARWGFEITDEVPLKDPFVILKT